MNNDIKITALQLSIKLLPSNYCYDISSQRAWTINDFDELKKYFKNLCKFWFELLIWDDDMDTFKIISKIRKNLNCASFAINKILDNNTLEYNNKLLKRILEYLSIIPSYKADICKCILLFCDTTFNINYVSGFLSSFISDYESKLNRIDINFENGVKFGCLFSNSHCYNKIAQSTIENFELLNADYFNSKKLELDKEFEKVGGIDE